MLATISKLGLCEHDFSEVSTPKQHSVMSLETPSEEDANTTSKTFFETLTYNTMSDDYSISDGELQVSENSCTSWQTQASHMNEGVMQV